jgi:hypothetical protein
MGRIQDPTPIEEDNAACIFRLKRLAHDPEPHAHSYNLRLDQKECEDKTCIIGNISTDDV